MQPSSLGNQLQTWDCPPALNLELKRERTKEEKEREVLHLFRCYTHTHSQNLKKPERLDLKTCFYMFCFRLFLGSRAAKRSLEQDLQLHPANRCANWCLTFCMQSCQSTTPYLPIFASVISVFGQWILGRKWGMRLNCSLVHSCHRCCYVKPVSSYQALTWIIPEHRNASRDLKSLGNFGFRLKLSLPSILIFLSVLLQRPGLSNEIRISINHIGMETTPRSSESWQLFVEGGAGCARGDGRSRHFRRIECAVAHDQWPASRRGIFHQFASTGSTGHRRRKQQSHSFSSNGERHALWHGSRWRSAACRS